MSTPFDGTKVTLTFNGSTFNIWDEGVREKFSIINGAQSKAVRRIRCAWSDRISLVQVILGGASVVAGTNLYVLGQPYPDLSAFTASDIDIDGEGLLSVGANGMVAYQWAIVKITYTPYLYNNQGIGTQRLSTSSNVLSVDRSPGAKSTFKWGSDSKDMPAEQSPAIAFTTVQITIERQVGTLNLGLYAGLANHRNSTTIFGLPPDKVIYWGIGQSVRVLTVLGAEMFTVDTNFEYNSYGWNKLYRPDTNAFDTFKFTNGDDLYPPADLTPLIQ